MIIISKKTYLLILPLLIFLLILLTGCFNRHSAADTALGYYDLILKQDASKLIALGMSKESASKVLSDMHTALRTQIKEDLSMANRVTISDSQIDAVEAAYLAALQPLKVTITSQTSGQNCNITLSTSYIDFSKIDSAASTLALKEINRTSYTDEALYLEYLVKAYIPHLIEGYQQATPSNDLQKASFIFIEQNGLWLPKDYAAFTNTLCKLATSKLSTEDAEN